jgi:hypothetical protein
MGIDNQREDLEKQPNEEFPFTFGFERHLASGETISSQTVVHVDIATGVAPSPSMLDGSPLRGIMAADNKTFTEDSSGFDISQQIKLGSDSGIYKLTYQVITSNGNTFEAELMVYVIDL